MKPIIITAYLRCGVVSDPWLPLDGVLLYEVARRQTGGGPDASLPGTGTLRAISAPTPKLPLLKVHDDQYWYYACSFAEWGQPYAEGRDYWNKRNDVDKFLDMLSRDVHRLDVGSGRYKSYHMPVFYRVAPWVRWWAIGEIDAIRDLLGGILALGKKRAYGWGRVIRWTVDETDQDRSLWVGPIPQRAIPVTHLAGHHWQGHAEPRTMQWSFRPPYYESANFATCYMPEGVRIAH